MKPCCWAATALALLILAGSACASEAKPDEAGAKETKSYAAIDRHALGAKPEVEETLANLAKYLVEPCKTDQEKARSVYRWITDRIAYNVEAFLSGKPGDNRPASVLKNRKAVCEGYANLFVDLCSRAGVKATKVHGYCKGFDYTPGKKFSDSNHTWNAVEIDGKEQLVDATWGAGIVADKKFVKQFAGVYYLIAPESLIWTHLPEKEKWQLLKPTLSLKQFEQQPVVGRSLVAMGMTAERIKAATSKKPFRGFVDAFTNPGYTIRLIDVPLTKHLESGKTYEFEIHSADCAEIVIAHNGNFTFPVKKGNVFRGSVKVQKGKLQIGGAAPTDKEKDYLTILEYEVE